MIINIHTKQYFALVRNFPHGRMLGIRLRCVVRLSCLGNSMISPGISRNTVIRLHTIPFVRTIPMSYPSLNCIIVSAIRPEIVVSDEDDISRIAFDSASISASLTLGFFATSS